MTGAIGLSEGSKGSKVTPHVSKDFQLSPAYMLQAGRQKLKRTQLCTQPPAELGGRLFKKKKKGTNYTWKDVGVGGEENAVSKRSELASAF